MKTPRLSIARMMGFVLVAAVGLVGLIRPTHLWASLMFTTAVVALIAAALNAALGPGRDRAFWLGFAASGWTYILIEFGLVPNGIFGPPPMIFTEAIIAFGAQVHPGLPISDDPAPDGGGPRFSAGIDPATTPFLDPGPTISLPPQPSDFASPAGLRTTGPTGKGDKISLFRIGHTLMALIAGLLGGWYSSFLAGRRDRTATAGPEVSPSSP